MTKKQVKFALFSLAMMFFAVGITEFISVGVLPAVSDEFNISTSKAGLITTMYAMGVAIGAPILTILTTKLPRKKTIISAIIVFILGHLFIGLAPSFALVVWGRLIAGAAHGLLFALSSTIAAELVGKSHAASAISYIFGGFTIATAIGSPLGTSVSDFLGWRIPFLIIAGISLLALILIQIAVPKTENSKKSVNLRSQLNLLTYPHVILTLIITILGYGGTFATFTYLSPILSSVTGVKTHFISLILLIYGSSIAIGNYIGGKIGNNNPVQILFRIFLAQTIALIAFYFTAINLALAIINIIILGLLAFMSVPILQSYILELAKSYSPEAMDLASSLNISAFSWGIVLGSFVGGIGLNNFGLRATALIGGAMVIIALLLNLVEANLEQKRVKIME